MHCTHKPDWWREWGTGCTEVWWRFGACRSNDLLLLSHTTEALCTDTDGLKYCLLAHALNFYGSRILIPFLRHLQLRIKISRKLFHKSPSEAVVVAICVTYLTHTCESKEMTSHLIVHNFYSTNRHTSYHYHNYHKPCTMHCNLNSAPLYKC